LALSAATASNSAASPRPDRSGSLWRVGVAGTALLIALPVLIIAGSLLGGYSSTWQHLLDTVLRDYVLNSLLLMLGVGVGTFVLGVSAAWLTAMCEFPGRRFFSWALLLPMAMPAYIIAYTYTGLLDYPGPVQSWLRATFDWSYGDYWFPAIRSLGGAICMLSLVLYPYVFLLVRVAFQEQSTAVLEASRSLGRSLPSSFFRVALPLARPAIAAGVSLALMETLADYGTVAYFGVSVFTTGIFRTWYGLGELWTAAQLAAFLLLFVLALYSLERLSRRRLRFYPGGNRAQARRLALRPEAAVAATLGASLLLTAGFLLPAGWLAAQVLEAPARALEPEFLALVGNSALLAGLAALVCLGLALFIGYGRRLYPGASQTVAAGIASMGYAVPGTVVAVGVLVPFAWFDNSVDSWLREHLGISTGLLLSGTLGALVFAYVVRFLSVALQTVEAGLARIRPSIDESARALGHAPGSLLRRVHVPMLRNSLMIASLLVFVDVLKELPTTLILRPFNFNTLAVRAHELASDERLTDAALPALSIVLIGLLPVILLTRHSGQRASTP
jgi:iron(III) transport system permease protein